ncbi:zinc finger protein 75A-like [Anopheles nili]|uniref:zinc finger protein 75A-like n=1 Tax=Anopheles nili TaxID=185578 RepID=UPI00237A1F44|nr:zinc finger protein 75A-like [Anopheles nili]
MALKEDSAIEITITNFNTCCRLCLSSDDSEYFDISNAWLPSQRDVSILEAVKKIINIEISLDDKLPSRICGQCSSRLNDAYSFVRETVRNYEMLQSYLDNEYAEGFCVESTSIDDENEDGESESLHDTISEPPKSNTASVLQRPAVEKISQMREQEEQREENQSQSNKNSDGDDKQKSSKNTLTAVEIILQQMNCPRTKQRRTGNNYVPKEYSCEMCDKTFRRKSNLIDHLRLHAQLKMYACDYCNKRFVQSGNLKAHLRTHTAEKPFQCNMCDKAYSQSSALKTHMLMHSNLRPFACDICDKSFTTSSDLSKHKLTHSKEKPFRCMVCPDRSFAQKVHLRNHIVRMHPTKNVALMLDAGTTH